MQWYKLQDNYLELWFITITFMSCRIANIASWVSIKHSGVFEASPSYKIVCFCGNFT